EPRMYLARARVKVASRQPEAALAALDEALKVLPDQPDLLWLQGNLLIDYGAARPDNLTRAAAVVAQMTKAGAAQSSVDYLQARALLLKGQWAGAAPGLENTRPTMERGRAPPGLLNQVDPFLAECYDQLDEPARQLAAYDRVLVRSDDPATPFFVEAQYGRATTLWHVGRLDEAIAAYRKILDVEKKLPAAG